MKNVETKKIKIHPHQTENAFILELCKINLDQATIFSYLATQKMDIPYLLGHLLYHRLGGLAYHRLLQANALSLLNRELYRTLQRSYAENLIQFQSLQQVGMLLADLLSDLPVPYAMMNDAYLLQMFDKGTRFVDTIDILIANKDAHHLERRLKRNGFRQGILRNGTFQPVNREKALRLYLDRRELFPWVKYMDLPGLPYLEVDLNFSMDYQGKDTAQVPDILARAQPFVSFHNTPLLAIASPIFLLQLCVHLAQEAIKLSRKQIGHDLLLYRFYDIEWFVYKHMNADFAREMIAEIQQYGKQQECYYALYHTRELFDIKHYYLDAVLDTIRPEDVAIARQVLRPCGDVTYHFDMDFKDWIFCSDQFIDSEA